jgi:hypothetical protein
LSSTPSLFDINFQGYIKLLSSTFPNEESKEFVRFLIGTQNLINRGEEYAKTVISPLIYCNINPFTIICHCER